MASEGSKKDLGWKYGYLANPRVKNNVTCKYCGKVAKGGIHRLEQHLVGGYRNITKCLECPEDVKKEIKSILKKRSEKKQTNLEVKTESIVVEDHCGESYKEHHHSPFLSDEVWRLENIGKDGAFHKHLSRENINTVKDFLILLLRDAPRLQNILGDGMSAKMWEVTVKHAWTLGLDKGMFPYCPSSSLLSECVTIDKLSETEKVDAQNLPISAFDQRGKVVPFGGGFDHTQSIIDFDQAFSFIGQVTNSLICDTETQGSCDEEHLQFLSNGSKFLSSHMIDGFDYTLPSPSSPDIDGGHLPSFDNYAYMLELSTDFAIFFAQRRWTRFTKVFSVVKCFSVRKSVNFKKNTTLLRGIQICSNG